MPNWRKVLQHGKDAHLNDLYLTGYLKATSLTGSLDWSYLDNVPTYDNYQHWNLKTNGTQRKQIQSTNDVDFKAGTDITINYGAGGQVLISSSFTESDTLDNVTSRGNSTSNDISVGSVTSSADIIADGNLEVKGGSVLFQGDASLDLMFELSGDPNNFDDFIQIGDVNNVGNGQLFSIDGNASEFLFQNGDVIASSSLRINGSLRTYTNNSGNNGDVLTSTGTQIDWINPTNLTVGNALTASYTENAVSASYVENALTASYVENATSASYAATASHTPPNWIFEWLDHDPVTGANYTVQFGNTISWQAGSGIKMSSTSPIFGTGAGVLIEVEDDTANGLTHELISGSLGTSLGDYDPKGFVEYAGIAITTTLGVGRVNANAGGQWKIGATSFTYDKHLAMGTSDTRVLARGIIVATGSFSGVGAGDPLFLGDNGVALGSAPTGSGEFVRIIGYMLDEISTTKAYIYFDPSNDWIEIA